MTFPRFRYLKEEADKLLFEPLKQSQIGKWETHWVITVPAIWNDAAKQFMTEAAFKVYFINV